MRQLRYPLVVALSTAMLTACNDDDDDRYSATIHYTQHDVPHIQADDYAGLGFGIGYVHGQDNLCTLAEQLVKMKGEKAAAFGPGENMVNVASDVGYKALGLPQEAAALLPQQPTHVRDLLDGYATGYNRALAERSGPQDYPSPCRGVDWVEPIDATTLLAYHLDLARLASARNFVTAMAAAQPPQQAPAAISAELDQQSVMTSEGIGSNGWALGHERVDGARSALIANPHFPWDGELRFFQQHLTIPGEMDINGVGMIGLPAVVIGFNQQLGWTHTVSQSKRFTLYQLQLDPNDATRYRYGNDYREMTSQDVTVQVRMADGSLQPHTQTVYFSHYGPLVNLESLSPALGWTSSSAITFRDANAGNARMLPQWLAMAKAQSRDEFFAAFAEHQGIPWVNTLMVAADGTASYLDGTQVPQLSYGVEQYWQLASQNPALAPIWQDGAGSVLLPGHQPTFEWQDSGDAGAPGLVPFSQAPQQTRTDYLFNANSSHWLSNLDEPLQGYSSMYGPEGTIRSPRTRYNAQLISDMSGNGLAGSDNRFSFEELKQVFTHNGALLANGLRQQLVERCSQYPQVQLDEAVVDLSAACTVLSNWDGLYNNDSRGAHLMREFLSAYKVESHRSLDDSLFAVPFDPQQPITTPRELASLNTEAAQQDPVLQNLARAAQRLTQLGIALDAPLGDLQYVIKAEGQAPLAVSGGYTFEGVFNMAETKLPSRSTAELANNVIGELVAEQGTQLTKRSSGEVGYHVNYGSSFVMALQYTEQGPQAEMFLSYGQSHDPESEFFRDQAQNYSDLTWRPMWLDQQQVEANSVRTVRIQQ
ncbi:acyl-homoserine-lactone acylase [Bacterioplanes sanyensis]|uniref:Acyl-homoserine-lactone acylase n=1 Tax=Bacterioplanes sanyensis TaxID=1249553 RepID=A0A222FF01_9GAMM|nr:penicillin acylase family protein [Bacterioplanes sanyensis]ASP37588.1 acyl-homoserine-lactone acylase [Bacterioplanes sanyensis]